MNEFVIDKNRYRVRYQHVIKDRKANNPELLTRFERDLKKRKAVTVATVERMIGKDPCDLSNCTANHEKWFQVQSGVAFCGKKDNFSKATGREVALTKLIQGMLERGAMYLAGRILMALGSDDVTSSYVGELRVTLVANKISGRFLVDSSPEGIGRRNVGKVDFD